MRRHVLALWRVLLRASAFFAKDIAAFEAAVPLAKGGGRSDKPAVVSPEGKNLSRNYRLLAEAEKEVKRKTRAHESAQPPLKSTTPRTNSSTAREVNIKKTCVSSPVAVPLVVA